MMAGFRALRSGCALNGQVAQLVEQRTENPCVGGSIPPLATKKTTALSGYFFAYYSDNYRYIEKVRDNNGKNSFSATGGLIT